MIYAVIDTNVIVSSLLTRNHDSATARVMNAVYEGKVIPLVCDEILGEYEEVLHRAQLKFDSRLVTGNLKDYPKADFVVSPSEFCIQFDL